jgi:pilus assembly protein Flp/PilA
MNDLVTYLRTLLSKRPSNLRERGASAVEYGLLVAGIAALVAAIVFTLGGKIHDKFNDTCNAVSSNSSTLNTGDCK